MRKITAFGAGVYVRIVKKSVEIVQFYSRDIYHQELTPHSICVKCSLIFDVKFRVETSALISTHCCLFIIKLKYDFDIFT